MAARRRSRCQGDGLDGGVVRVPAEALFAAGVPLGAAASSIQLFRAGRRVPRTVVAADGVALRGGDAVEFYGYPMDTRYSGSAVYWLTAGQGTGLELSSSGAPGQGAALTSFLASAEIRERLTWFGAARNGHAEKFFGPAVFSTARQRVIPLDALDVSGAGARLELAFQGLTEVSHAVAVSVNGLPVGSVTFAGATPGSAVIPLPPGTLVAGDNTVALVAPATGDVSLERYVRIRVPALHDQRFGGAGVHPARWEATRLDGFDPALTRVLDITDPGRAGAPCHLGRIGGRGGGGTRNRFPPTPGLSSDGRCGSDFGGGQSSEQLARRRRRGLVIVGSASLLPEVQSLVDARRAQGLSVAMVDVEDVQDEFASGEKSADALRAFVQQAVQAWIRPPRYLLLLGSASFDPRDYLGLGGRPGSQRNGPDRFTAGAAGGGFRQLVPGCSGCGRAQHRSAPGEDARTRPGPWWQRSLGRREADSRARVLLVSDRMSTSDFLEMTSDLQAALPDAQPTVLLRGTDPDPAKQQALDALAHQQFLDALHTNPALVNFAGHAAETFWTDGTPSLYSVDDVAALAGSQPGLWGRHDLPHRLLPGPAPPQPRRRDPAGSRGGCVGRLGQHGDDLPRRPSGAGPGAGEGAAARREDARRSHAGGAGRDERLRCPVDLRAAGRSERARRRDRGAPGGPETVGLLRVQRDSRRVGHTGAACHRALVRRCAAPCPRGGLTRIDRAKKIRRRLAHTGTHTSVGQDAARRSRNLDRAEIALRRCAASNLQTSRRRCVLETTSTGGPGRARLRGRALVVVAYFSGWR